MDYLKGIRSGCPTFGTGSAFDTGDTNEIADGNSWLAIGWDSGHCLRRMPDDRR